MKGSDGANFVVYDYDCLKGKLTSGKYVTWQNPSEELVRAGRILRTLILTRSPGEPKIQLLLWICYNNIIRKLIVRQLIPGMQDIKLSNVELDS